MYGAVADVSRLQRGSRPADRRRRLIRHSDALLRTVEQLNVDAYRPYRPEQPVKGGRKVVKLPANVAQNVHELLIEVGLHVRRLRTTADALEAVWSAQRRILGQLEGDEGD